MQRFITERERDFDRWKSQYLNYRGVPVSCCPLTPMTDAELVNQCRAVSQALDEHVDRIGEVDEPLMIDVGTLLGKENRTCWKKVIN